MAVHEKEGVEILKADKKPLAGIEVAVTKREFTAAIAKTRELRANCKSCHEKYKPKKR